MQLNVWGEISKDDIYDSFQWYRQAGYQYDQRKNPEASAECLRMALKLHPDNYEARGFARFLAEKKGIDFENILKINMPLKKASSPVTRRWYENGKDAFENGEFKRAIHCVEKARTLEPGYAGIDLLERKIREEISYQFYLKRYELSEFELINKTPDEKRILNFNEVLINTILKSKVTYNPQKSRDWLGLARYFLKNAKDVKKAKKLAEVAKKYAPDSKIVEKFLEEIKTEKLNVEKKKKQELAERLKLEEEKRKKEAEEDRKKRTVDVTETLIKKTGKVHKIGRNEFFEIPFWEETKEVDFTTLATEIDLNNPKTKTVDVSKLRNYISEKFESGKENYSKGFYQEALLEHEKAYLRVLSYNNEDLRAHYNLILIYNKLGERRAALEQLMKLLAVLKKNKTRSYNDPYYKKVNRTTYCWILGTVIHAAFLGYNSSGKGKMSRETFVVSRLIKAGYLNFKNTDKKIQIKLSGNVSREKTIEFTVDKVACPEGGRYFINKGGRLECSVHGVSPLVTVKFEFDKFNK